MKYKYRFSIGTLLFILFAPFSSFSQTATFASLDGNGFTMNTAGWTVMGSALNGASLPNIVDTPGDPDFFANELILAPQANLQAGGVFFNGSLDPSTTCDYWIADFDVRMFDGNAYDGMAFIVTSQIPASLPSSSGGFQGMPQTGFTGFSVCLDGYGNCATSVSPELQLRYNTTEECPVPTQPTQSNLPILINTNYNNIRVVYNQGNISVYLNGSPTPNLTGFYNLNFPVFFGMTAANGGGGDALYSVKNYNIYVPQPTVDAGPLVSGCEGATASIGSVGFPDYTYLWSPSTFLSDATSPNPTVTFNTSAIVADTQLYVLSATIGSCTIMDTAKVVSIPFPTAPTLSVSEDTVCAGTAVIITANTLANEVVEWYSSPTGGISFFTGSVFSTNPLSTTLSNDTTFYAETTNGSCVSLTRTPITVVVNAAPPSPTASAADICEGEDGVFQATAPFGVIFTWYTVPSGGLPVFTGAMANIGVTQQDTALFVEATSPAGCKSLTRTLVNLNTNPTPATPILIGDTVCFGQPAVLSAQPIPGATIQWFSSPVATTPLATGINYTTPPLTQNIVFYAKATSFTGCVGEIGSVSVVVNPRPDTASVVGDTICPGKIANLSCVSPSGVLYHWFDSPTGGTPIFTGNPYNVALNTTTSYYVETSALGCPSSKRIKVVGLVDYIPAPPKINDVDICKWESATLQVLSPSDEIAHFSWYSLPGNVLVNEGKFHTLTNVENTLSFNVVSYSFLANCPSENSEVVNLTVQASPLANFTMTPSDTVEVNQTIYFQDSSLTAIGAIPSWGIRDYWTFGDGYYSTSLKPSFSFPEEGLYPVTLIATNAFGCSDTITQHVFVYDIREVEFPTAFTPNGDGHNETFEVLGSRNFNAFSMVIYDRWGKLVYSSTNMSEGWNGKQLNYGEDCPEGAYMCVIDYVTAKGIKRTVKTSVTILR